MHHKMTLEELSYLTQKQIKEYVAMTYPDLKIPKKWQDKATAIAWLEKNVFNKTTGAVVEPPKKVDNVPAVIPKNKMNAKERRELIVSNLRMDYHSSKQLAKIVGITPKQITNDLFAIKMQDEKYLDLDETIVDKRDIKEKVFKIKKK